MKTYYKQASTQILAVDSVIATLASAVNKYLAIRLLSRLTNLQKAADFSVTL